MEKDASRGLFLYLSLTFSLQNECNDRKYCTEKCRGEECSDEESCEEISGFCEDADAILETIEVFIVHVFTQIKEIT